MPGIAGVKRLTARHTSRDTENHALAADPEPPRQRDVSPRKALSGADNDGSSKYRLLLTSVRIVCANTQSAAIAGAKSTFGIRHTNGARVAIQEARTALGLAWRYMDAFETEAAALYVAPMELDQMRDFAARLVKADDKTASVTARRGRQQQASSIVKLWMSPTIAPIAGTRWAAYNAVTEYLDHFQPVRGARTSRAAADTRALRAVTPGSGVETLKLDAFRLLQTTSPGDLVGREPLALPTRHPNPAQPSQRTAAAGGPAIRRRAETPPALLNFFSPTPHRLNIVTGAAFRARPRTKGLTARKLFANNTRSRSPKTFRPDHCATRDHPVKRTVR